MKCKKGYKLKNGTCIKRKLSKNEDNGEIRYGKDINFGKWTCSKDKSNSGDMIFCRSKKGKLLSAFGDETVRFSSDKNVKIDGRILEEGIKGVELE